MTDATETEIQRRVAQRLAELQGIHEFVPFPVPIHPNDTPLVQHAGEDYRCTGCGAAVPDGVRIHETVKDGVVQGMRMEGGPDGQFRHQCGQVGD